MDARLISRMKRVVNHTGHFELIPFASSDFMTPSMQRKYDEWRGDHAIRDREFLVKTSEWMGAMLESNMPNVKREWRSIDSVRDATGGEGFKALDSILGAGKSKGVQLGRVRSIGRKPLDMCPDHVYHIGLEGANGRIEGGSLGIRVLEMYNGFSDLLHGALDGFKAERSSSSTGALVIFTVQGSRDKNDRWAEEIMGFSRSSAS